MPSNCNIIPDAFYKVNQGFFAVHQVERINKEKMEERLLLSEYLYNPLKRSFKAVIRITAMVILANTKLMKILIRSRIREGTLTSQRYTEDSP